MNLPNSPLFQIPPSIYTLPKLRSLPLREQPAYRITSNASACSLPELLAALIGGEKQIETAEALLAYFKGDIRGLYHAHPAELVKVRGVNQATAIRIKAAFNLGLRLNLPTEERPTINSPADAAALVQHEMGLLEKEHLRVLLLNTRNHVLDIVEVYAGSVNSSQVRIAEVMRPAIQRLATGIIACHNHPSQDPSPSPDDVAVTRAMVQAAKLLDIDFLDHLIICQQKFVSLKKKGLVFLDGGAMSAIQIPFNFTPITPPPEPERALADTSWRDFSEIAHGAGFRCPCLVSAELLDQLDDQALYDALWTACFTLSLDKVDCALFTLELDGKPMRFKVLKTNNAAYLGRVEDF